MRRFLQVEQPLFDLGAHRFRRMCSESGSVVLLFTLSGLVDVRELSSLEPLREPEDALLELGKELEPTSSVVVKAVLADDSKSHALGVS